MISDKKIILKLKVADNLRLTYHECFLTFHIRKFYSHYRKITKVITTADSDPFPPDIK